MWHIYADGSCPKPQGPGGWGVYGEHLPLSDHIDEHVEICGGTLVATNNTMELEAVKQALLYAYRTVVGPYMVFTDSEYVQKGLTEWSRRWEKNGWRNSKGEPVANQVAWKALRALYMELRCPKIVWVKGHNGTPGNERADQLADDGRLNAIDAG